MPSGRDPRTVGVVLLPAGQAFQIGPSGSFSRHPPPLGASVFGLMQVLEGAGFKVILPAMPWTPAHQYDRTLDQVFGEIDATAAKLKGRGAAVVVVVGHSFGGGVAVAYGARGKDVAGVVAVVAGPDADEPKQRTVRARSVAKARRMIAEGHADEVAAFDDTNLSVVGVVHTTAADYLSFFDPESGMSLHRDLAQWPPDLPLLWIDGSDEAQRPRRVRMVQHYLPPHTLSHYLAIPAVHNSAADAAGPAIVAWIRCL